MHSRGDLRHRSRAGSPFPRLRLRDAIHLGNCCVLLGLLGAFGVLAFVFSAVSPEDDDIQQAFQVHAPVQRVLENFKSASEVRKFGTGTVLPQCFVQPRLTIRCAIVGRVLSVDEKIIGPIVGSRSPPSKSS